MNEQVAGGEQGPEGRSAQRGGDEAKQWAGASPARPGRHAKDAFGTLKVMGNNCISRSRMHFSSLFL